MFCGIAMYFGIPFGKKLMNILLTNDDSIYAKGLWALYERFAKKHSVTVVAPDREQSAVGHGITLYQPLRMVRIRVDDRYAGYAVNGTPADCIKLGFGEVLGSKPDMVISGINPGLNVGSSVNYSGTVAAAREAALYEVPAMAVSIGGNEGHYYEDAAHFANMAAEKVFEKGLPAGTFLNVNIPDIPMAEIAGVQVSRQDITANFECFEKRTDPRNWTYFWLGKDTRSFEQNADTDGAAIFRKYISITPLKCDMTDYRAAEDVRGWFEQGL